MANPLQGATNYNLIQAESALMYQMQKMQDELDYLRGVIDTSR